MTDHGLFTPDDDPEPNPRVRHILFWVLAAVTLLIVAWVVGGFGG